MGEKKLLLCPKIPISICNLFICPQCVCNTFISLLMFIYLVIRKNSEKTFIKNTQPATNGMEIVCFERLSLWILGYWWTKLRLRSYSVFIHLSVSKGILLTLEAFFYRDSDYMA